MGRTLNLRDGKLVFNGINGATGEYLLRPMSPAEVAALARGGAADPARLDDLQRRVNERKQRNYLVRRNVDPNNLEEAGWGVIFTHDADPGIREALRPLLQLRRGQASRRQEQRYREYTGSLGYRPGETNQAFVARQGMGPGPVDPDRVPYYLLIVGDPEAIPFSFQYQLDVQYAVGRIWFDAAADYARYAESVVRAESGDMPRVARRAVLFGTQNPDDVATGISAEYLVKPLADIVPARLRAGQPAWDVQTVIGEEATKARLARLLGGGAETPGLLFTASHGMGFPLNDPRQAASQGALLCQDWPGPMAGLGEIRPDFYFGGDDVPTSARLDGLIAFLFACYGAGTPQRDEYPTTVGRPPEQIAPRAFVASLPRRLLGRGALSAVGHVERAWGCSILWDEAGQQIGAFEDALGALMEGQPVGLALEGMNQRYADVGVALNKQLEDIRFGAQPDEADLAAKWIANNDARAYVIIGDPAVRLPLEVAAAGAAPPPGSAPAPARVPVDPFPTASRAQRTTKESKPMSDATSRPASDASPSDPSSSSAGGVTIGTPVSGRSSTAGVTITIPLTINLPFDGAAIRGDGGAAPGFRAAGGGGAAAPFAITIDPDYATREGYDPEFLGGGTQAVPLPRMTAAQLRDAALADGADAGDDPHELKYHHFSVVLNARRGLAFFTAVNIDGRSAKSPKRKTDKWCFDPRVGRDEQVGEDLYASNPFDRGHLVRRLDPAWGRSAGAVKMANDDTFHFTNCAPQHERFNQGKNLWAGLEDFLLNKAADERKRLTVFTGPVFRDDDPNYRGTQVPLKFWKVAVVARPNGKLAVVAFLVTQEDLVRQAVSFAALDVARTFQVPVRRVEQLSGLSFGRLRDFEVASVVDFAVPAVGAPAGAAEARPLESYDDIRISGPTDGQAGGLQRPSSFDPTSSAQPTPAATPVAPRPAAVIPPTEQVPGTDIRYYLLAYDGDGRERRRTSAPAGLVSRFVVDAVRQQPVTDVFLFSHGWMGDVPSAREQYGGWIGAMAAHQDDRERIRRLRPGFLPLLVGLHWPSLPWGDEQFAVAASPSSSAPVDFGAKPGAKAGAKANANAPRAEDAALQEAIVEEYVRRLGDTPEERARLRAPLEALAEAVAGTGGGDDDVPNRLPDNVVAAYMALDKAVGLASDGVAGEPGGDREPFDPQGVYQDARLGQAVSRAAGPGGVSFRLRLPTRDELLAPLRTLSFWKMKDRARRFGEGAVHPLLAELQQAVSGRGVRFHLAGHSFGAIVASAAVAGPVGGSGLPQPVDSVALIQGALSLWAYCTDIPFARGTPGYFSRIFAEGRVRGPVVTTQSRFDSAVGTWYPRAAQARGQVAFAPGQLPKYGSIGTFGIQGGGPIMTDGAMLAADAEYELAGGGRVYNFDGSAFIREGGGFSGAHSDIRRPEVAHLVWSAAMVGL
jgi:DNA/RNA endonuclease G (NUC1)